MPDALRQSASEAFLNGGGEMGGRMRRYDWAGTPLGPPSAWPQSLKTTVRIMLDSRYAMWMAWGEALTFFCNDAYLPTVGLKRDWVLGAPSDRVWSEIWPDIGPRIAHVLRTGEATWDEALLLYLERSGFPEETYHTFSYSPVYDDANRVAGMLCVVTEVTERVIGERRLQALHALAARAAGPSTVLEVCRRAATVLSGYASDLPVAAIYLLEGDRRFARLAATTRELDETQLPPRMALADPSTPPHIRELLATGSLQHVTGLPGHGIAVPATPWPELLQQALVVPLKGSGVDGPFGFMLAGISTRRVLDRPYREFVELAAQQISASISDARTYQAERERAEALAEIDRAKTTFFSNVSHEFRTPLTLMLGPLETLLARHRADPEAVTQLGLAHDNALRLQKLVNSLLEFSRLEAGRVRASFQPTDLAALTRDLASSFRSAIERAGLVFEVDCAALDEPIHVDRGMWESIVLNLLSNALKFTLEGRISVRLHDAPEGAVLEVADTGTGIAPEELPRLFERFQRLKARRSRTHEGTGIGLALAHELVRLHGGHIAVQSALDRGTTFTVRLPRGSAHLPRAMGPPPAATAAGPDGAASGAARAFVQEALGWLPGARARDAAAPDGAAAPLPAGAAADYRFRSTFGARVVVVDDNADMRSYLASILQPHYRVQTHANGQEALDALRRERPALLVSDLMMPVLDGFQLLAAIRADPALRSLPVVVVSARAGEEARVDGLDAGADDYLVKPFSSRELLARVGSLIERSWLRTSAEQRFALGLVGAQMFVWEWDIASDNLYASENAEALFGEPLTHSARSLDRIHPEDRARHEAAIRRAIAERSLLDDRVRFIHPVTGETRWIDVRAAVVPDAAGNPAQLSGVTIDVTDRQRAEAGREAALVALREADRRKDEFLATLAHELRNPLAPVVTAARLLGDPQLGAEGLQWCRDMIQRQVGQMSLLLDDLLEVSRITLGRVQLRRRAVEVRQLVDAAVETARPLIDAREHQLEVHFPDGPLSIEADALRISQVISNLLTNAAKYTDPGGRIVVTVAPGPGHVEIAVTDNGIGLAPEECARIFRMFSQVEGALQRSQGGLGIGLALVKGLVELHGGEVSVQSAGHGRGCTFTLRLPAPAPAPPPEAAVPPAPGSAAESAATARTVAAASAETLHRSGFHETFRILVADDNRDAAESLATLLRLGGHDVRVAFDGRQAVRVFDEFEPEVAVLDIGMPEMNGYDVARELRRTSAGQRAILVALTGWGQDENKRRTREAGFDGHVTKPADPDALAALFFAIRARRA
ncbi:MAG: ATP-binding protein [Steroidobacteraceae bacterium]|jgi:PAS domain S-box-containing protein|nr:ATP-binding protein [Steroidobacteraceae bacterium]